MAVTNGQVSNNGHAHQHNGYINHQGEPEICKVVPNALYLTFNAPQVDDYHRGLFLTHPLSTCLPTPLTSGTLYHAQYVNQKWLLESRVVNDITSSKSLALLYRLTTYEGQDMKAIAKKLDEVMNSVPIGRLARTKALGEKLGNPVLDLYDCVIWTVDALDALDKAGLIDLDDTTADELMTLTRSLAGPKDAKTMVGVDFGGFRVINREVSRRKLSTTSTVEKSPSPSLQ